MPARSPDVRVFPDAPALADAAAREVLAIAAEAIAARGQFSIALSGGTTPRATYERLASMRAGTGTWYVGFGDERVVPPEDPDSNAGMASRAWLAASAIPPENVFA